MRLPPLPPRRVDVIGPADLMSPPMFRASFYLLIACALVVELGVVRPCLLDETVAAWFHPAPSHDEADHATVDVASVRPLDPDADGPFPARRPAVPPAYTNPVGRLPVLSTHAPLVLTLDAVPLVGHEPAGYRCATSDPPNRPGRLAALTLPLLI